MAGNICFFYFVLDAGPTGNGCIAPPPPRVFGYRIWPGSCGNTSTRSQGWSRAASVRTSHLRAVFAFTPIGNIAERASIISAISMESECECEDRLVSQFLLIGKFHGWIAQKYALMMIGVIGVRIWSVHEREMITVASHQSGV